MGWWDVLGVATITRSISRFNNSSTLRTNSTSGYLGSARPWRCTMAESRNPSTARMTGAWNTLPAKPNPTKPTLSMAVKLQRRRSDGQKATAAVALLLERDLDASRQNAVGL